MKYLKQRDKYSCGPVSLVNVFRYLGKRVSLKEMRDLTRCMKLVGTNVQDYHKAVMKLFKYDFDFQPLLKDIVFNLKKNRPALVFVVKKGQGGHFFCLTGVSKDAKLFQTVNLYMKEKLVIWISRSELRSLLRSRSTMCWYILRGKNDSK